MLLLTLVHLNAAQAEVGTSRNFNVIDPASWQYAQGAVDDMAQDWGSTWTAEPGHQITYGVVEDADEPGVYYFATTRDEGDGQKTLSLFRYDTSTFGFQRLMKIPDVVNASWYVVGYDTGYVVYAETSGTYDRGTCGEPMVSATDGNDGSLYKMPDNYSQSWSEGASMYSYANSDLQTARDRETDCGQSGGGAQ